MPKKIPRLLFASLKILPGVKERVVHRQWDLIRLKGYPYETSKTQEKFTESTTMRNDLEQAMSAQDGAGIEQACQSIHIASLEFVPSCRKSRYAGRHDGHPDITSDDARDVLNRAARLNLSLQLHGVDTNAVEELVLVVGHNVAGIQNSSGFPGFRLESKNQAELGECVSLLRDTYRRILIREYLPQSVAQEVLAVAQLFDKTAGNMGIY
ncbi:MAG: hypothetical protein WC586_09740 [Methanoregula sp.]